MRRKPRAAELLSVPGPLVLGVGCGVDADPSAAAQHPVSERLLLRIIEHVACRREEHDRAVAREPLARECARVLGVVDGPCGAKPLAQRLDSVRNRRVPESCGAGEDHDAGAIGVGWGSGTRQIGRLGRRILAALGRCGVEPHPHEHQHRRHKQPRRHGGQAIREPCRAHQDA